jgi:hypothetical protein
MIVKHQSRRDMLESASAQDVFININCISVPTCNCALLVSPAAALQRREQRIANAGRHSPKASLIGSDSQHCRKSHETGWLPLVSCWPALMIRRLGRELIGRMASRRQPQG